MPLPISSEPSGNADRLRPTIRADRIRVCWLALFHTQAGRPPSYGVFIARTPRPEAGRCEDPCLLPTRPRSSSRSAESPDGAFGRAREARLAVPPRVRRGDLPRRPELLRHPVGCRIQRCPRRLHRTTCEGLRRRRLRSPLLAVRARALPPHHAPRCPRCIAESPFRDDTHPPDAGPSPPDRSRGKNNSAFAAGQGRSRPRESCTRGGGYCQRI